MKKLSEEEKLIVSQKNQNKYEKITLVVSKEEKNQLQNHSKDAHEKSLSNFIVKKLYEFGLLEI